MLDLPAWNDCSDREIGKPKWLESRNNLKAGTTRKLERQNDWNVRGHKYIGGTLSLTIIKH